MRYLMAPVCPGEVLDKLTILQIKCVRFSEASEARTHALYEHNLLLGVWEQYLQGHAHVGEIERLQKSLLEVNGRLWDLENAMRDGGGSIVTARAICVRNEERAALKKRVNTLLGSEIVEEKRYAREPRHSMANSPSNQLS